MNLTKKQRERQSLDAVLKHFATVPTDIEETEEPDFLLTIDGTIVGAEVTELYLPSPPDAELPMQATENEERLMVEMARRQAIQSNVPPQQLQVRLSPHVLKKQNRERVSAILCDYVASNFAAPGEVKSGTRHLLPTEIVHITMYGLRTSDHQWNGPCSGWVNSDFADGFQAVIAKKEPLLPKYLRHCEKCWLITIATSDGGSSFIEWSDQLASREFSAEFDRVFFVQGLANNAYELQLATEVAQQ